MNKEQSAMILRGSDPKNMLNSTISMSYPDAQIACIEHKVSLKNAIEAALVKHDNNMKDYFWWLTDHHNLLIIQLFSL